MVTVHDAHRIIRESLQHEARTQTLPLRQLAGKVIAMDIHAGFPMPRFTNAAMDGFAVRWNDISGATPTQPLRLKVTQDIPAGVLSILPLEEGSCARIMTGAPIPEGADTVVAFEQTSGFGTPEVDIFNVPKRGANIRHAGEEIPAGTLLINKGTRLTPAEIAILSALGIAETTAFLRPKVGIVTTGDELRMPGEEAEPLAIYNSNLFMLEACCHSAGADVAGSWQVPDDPPGIRAVLKEAMPACDLLLTVGGISTGEYDHIEPILAELGISRKFWNVAQKPGKPLYFGTAPSGIPVFSLPGNPVSAVVCFLEYCLPVLYAMQETAGPSKIEAILDEPFPADSKRHRFLFGQLHEEEGLLRCRIASKKESHMLTSMAGANCLAESPPTTGPLPAGSRVTCTPLPWSPMSIRSHADVSPI